VDEEHDDMSQGLLLWLLVRMGEVWVEAHNDSLLLLLFILLMLLLAVFIDSIDVDGLCGGDSQIDLLPHTEPFLSLLLLFTLESLSANNPDSVKFIDFNSFKIEFMTESFEKLFCIAFLDSGDSSAASCYGHC
jgi:hypothetical protein